MMLGNDSLPRPPRSTRTLDEFRDTRPSGEPERGVAPRPSGESLFGDFIRSRQDAVEFKSRDSTTKNRRHSPKTDRRRKSKSPTDVLQNDPIAPQRTRSPGPKSPRDSKNKSSPRKSPGYASPKSKSPGQKGSPRQKGGPLSSDARKHLDDSFPDLGATPIGDNRKKPESSDDESDSLPALIDDSTTRIRVEGFRGGKQWNIMEDTPGGHAPEKLVIVEGIEYFGEEDDDFLEEDEDIEDDDHQPGLIDRNSQSGRKNRRKTLPADPVAVKGVPAQIRKAHAGHDRFDPSFKNNEMWVADYDEDARLCRSHSGDVSILSDQLAELDTVSELGVGSCGFADDQTSTIATDDISHRKLALDETRQTDDDSGNPSSLDISKTPATKKRSGCRASYNTGGIDKPPNLTNSTRTSALDEDGCESLEHPASVPEDAPLGNSKRRSRRKKKIPSAPLSPNNKSSSSHKLSSSYERAKGNNNSGRSNRRSTHSGSRRTTGMDRNPMRGSRPGRKIPDVVPATPASWVRCSPMSSSLTSTPTSMVSSMQQQQQASLQQLRQKRRKNKPLHMHVGRELSTDDGDDHTLGASTITTNFSTTQRTRGENTVSTRSLFRSDQMSQSEKLTIPQRRREESDYDQSDEDDQSSTMLDDNEELHSSAEHLDGGYDALQVTKPVQSTFQTLLRRPSGEGDDMLDMIPSAHYSKSSDDASNESNSSELLRWQKENGNLISPKADLKKTIEPGSHAFLELNIDGNGVQVDSKISEVPDFTSPENGLARVDVRDAPQMKQMNGQVMRAPDSPGDLLGKKKKSKGRLALFKRKQSWKGGVALSDEDE